MPNVTLRGRLAAALILLLAGARLQAQAREPMASSGRTAERAELVAATVGDSVVLLLGAEPPRLGGFVVYRANAAGAGAVRLTSRPVEAERDPVAAAARIGADLPLVIRATRAADGAEAVRRLRGDELAAAVLVTLSPSTADALGRRFVDGTAAAGAEYVYRVAFTDARGQETGRVLERRVTVRERRPDAPTLARAQVAAKGAPRVTVRWSYPKWTGRPEDVVVGYHVYRAEEGGPGESALPRRLTTTPVLRDDARAPELRDDDVRVGATYRYVVRSVDIVGRESERGAEAVAKVIDLVAPAAPAEVAVRGGEGEIRVAWPLAPEADVAGWRVERARELHGAYTPVGAGLVPAVRPEYRDTLVTGGVQYFYRVIAVDAAGNASRPSAPLAGIATDRTPPLAPANVLATVEKRRVRMTWSPSASRDVRGYFVYRGDSAERLVRVTKEPVSATAFVDSGYASAGLTPGARYEVRVSAVDSLFNESPMAAAVVSVPDDEAPGAPTGVHARNVLGRWADIGWSSSPATDVAAYVVVRETGATIDTLATVGVRDAWALRDSTVRHGERYVYRVAAIDRAGNVGPAGADTLAFKEFTPPPAPRFLAAALPDAPAGRAAQGVRLSWERVVDDELAGYVVYRAALETGTYVRVTAQPTLALTLVDPAGTPASWYVVRAVDRSGNESRPSPTASLAR